MKAEKLQKLAVGTRVYLSSSLLDFYKTQAFEFCAVPQDAGPKFVDPERDLDYVAWRALGFRMPYEAKIKQHRAEVGEGPGALVTITMGQIKLDMLIDTKDLRVTRSRRKK